MHQLLSQVSDWLPKQPFQVVSFDCDATLSHLEGINVLATQNGVGSEVAALTQKAMRETGLCPSLYRERLELVRPSSQQMLELGGLYFDERTPNACLVIALLQSLGKRVYVLSAGLLPSVKVFSEKLQVPSGHVYAVDCFFNEDGSYNDYEQASLLTKMDGKLTLLRELCDPEERIAHVGDGMNDVAVAGKIESFVGFGGGKCHDKIKQYSDQYIINNSLAPLLPLVLTAEEVLALNPAQQALFEKGCQAILSGQVLR